MIRDTAKKRKSISWKTAFIVVIVMHGLGYAAIKQYSSYRIKKNKELKQLQELVYADKNTADLWPKTNLPMVVHYPPPLKPNILPKKPTNDQNYFKTLFSWNYIKGKINSNLFKSKIQDFFDFFKDNKEMKQIAQKNHNNKNVSQTPAKTTKPTQSPSKNTFFVSTTKPVQIPTKINIPKSKPSPTPAWVSNKRNQNNYKTPPPKPPAPISSGYEPQTTVTSVRTKPANQNIPSIISTIGLNPNYDNEIRETSSVSRRVVQTYVVLQ